jgi:hypothetical protein
VIGRVVVDRAIRLAGGAAGDIRGALAALPDRSASTSSDFLCSRCGAVVCESARVKLFSGVVLKCVRCEQPNPVPR